MRKRERERERERERKREKLLNFTLNNLSKIKSQ